LRQLSHTYFDVPADFLMADVVPTLEELVQFFALHTDVAVHPAIF
jgi:hypothetical protein